MKIILCCIGQTDTPHVREAIAIYSNRLKHYIPFEITIITEKKTWKKMDAEKRKNEEGKAILACIEPGDMAVLLDEKGKEYNSEGFAGFLQKAMNTGTKRLVFVVGGAFGFSKEVYSEIPQKLSLSKMTFSHQLIRTLMMEQLYRGMTILRNEPYHNR